MDPADETQAFTRLAKTFGVILSAVLVCVFFAFLGSMSYPGLGAVVGGLIGFPIGGVIGFFACGKYKDFLEEADRMVDASDVLPEFMHEGVFGHSRFTLYVTVHRIKGAANKRGPFGGSDNFIRILCGRNPPKTTCVRESGTWNETFKLMVEPQDSSITFEVIDQNTLIDTKVASVAVPISTIVPAIGQGETEEKLQSKSKSMGVLVVSYKAGEDISANHLPESHRDVYTSVRDRTVDDGSGARLYGTFASHGAQHKSAYFNTHPSSGISAYSKPGSTEGIRIVSRDLLGSGGSARGVPPRQPTQGGLRGAGNRPMSGSPFSSGQMPV